MLHPIGGLFLWASGGRLPPRQFGRPYCWGARRSGITRLCPHTI